MEEAKKRGCRDFPCEPQIFCPCLAWKKWGLDFFLDFVFFVFFFLFLDLDLIFNLFVPSYPVRFEQTKKIGTWE